MAPKITRKDGNEASKGSDQLNSKAETDSDNVRINSTAGYNTNRCMVSTKNQASDEFLASAVVVTANTSAGAGGEDASTGGVPSDVKSTTPTESYAAKSWEAAVAETARPIAIEVYGDGDADGKIVGGAGAMHAPPTTLPHGLEIIPAETGAVAAAVEVNVVDANATYKSVISGMARANESNPIGEENYYILHWLYRIRRVGCARGLLIGFLQPDFLFVVYGPMMRSKKLWRTDGDIRVAANLWCSNRAAAEERYGRISEWDVSSVTDMSELFRDKREFNDDIGRWDVSNVTNMSRMFFGAYAFNQPVRDWDVSKVTNMNQMFYVAQSFNQVIGDWDVSKVTDMQEMFHIAHSFNHPVGNWDVSKITDMYGMFHEAELFNQDLTRWDMRSVKDARYMFLYANAMQRDNKPAAVRDDVYEE